MKYIRVNGTLYRVGENPGYQNIYKGMFGSKDDAYRAASIVRRRTKVVVTKSKGQARWSVDVHIPWLTHER